MTDNLLDYPNDAPQEKDEGIKKKPQSGSINRKNPRSMR